MKKILAASWHPGGINAIIPVIKRLKEEKRINLEVIGHEYSEKILEKDKISYKTIKDYHLDDISIGSMEKLLKIESPDLVLTGTSIQDEKHKEVLEQTITLAAKEKGIKSISVLDFWVNYFGRFSDLYTNGKFDYKDKQGKFRFLPDKIAIMDKLAEKEMLEQKFPKDVLVITGNPYFDDLIKLKNNFSEKDKEQVKRDFGINIDSYFIIYGSQPLGNFYGEDDSNPRFLGYTEKTALCDLIESLNKFKDRKNISLLVKAHPRENKEDLINLIKRFDDFPISVDQDYPTRQAVLAADAIFSPVSTLLVETSYLDKPSISIQPGLKNIKEDMLITNSLGVTVPIYKKEKIDGVVKKLLFDKYYLKELDKKRKDFKIDGKATQRVINLIYEMI